MRQWAPPCRPQRGSAELSFSPLGGFARFGPLLAHTILELFLFTRWAMQIVLSRSVSFRCVFLLLLPASASAHSSRSTIDQYQIDQLDACLDFHGDEQHADSWLRAVDCSETDALCSASASSEACLYITSEEQRDADHSSRAQVFLYKELSCSCIRNGSELLGSTLWILLGILCRLRFIPWRLVVLLQHTAAVYLVGTMRHRRHAPLRRRHAIAAPNHLSRHPPHRRW